MKQWRCSCQLCGREWFAFAGEVSEISHMHCPWCGAWQSTGEVVDSGVPDDYGETTHHALAVALSQARARELDAVAKAEAQRGELRKLNAQAASYRSELIMLRALLREVASDLSLCRWPSAVWLRKTCKLLGMDPPGSIFGPREEGQHGDTDGKLPSD